MLCIAFTGTTPAPICKRKYKFPQNIIHVSYHFGYFNENEYTDTI